MCGRTALTATPEDLADALALDELPATTPHYNVPPSQSVAVLRAGAGSARTLDLLRWGLVPRWPRDAKLTNNLALARVETVATAPAFRDAVRLRRCLVIVDGFYEWRREGARRSQPFVVRRADRAPFGLAAIWERTRAHMTGGDATDGEIVESCAIITQPARPPVAGLHDRMPLIIEREAWDRWLDPVPLDPAALAPLLAEGSPSLIAYPVSTHVNDPRHDDPRCLEPARQVQLTLC